MPTFPNGSVYEKLGIKPVINARGNSTILGGSVLGSTVRRSMEEADLNFVEMRELMEKAGEFISKILGTEAAYVTSGCAAAINLSTAACMAGTDIKKIGQLPDTNGMKNQIVIQKRQRYNFDRCFTLSGAKLFEAGDQNGCDADQLDAAISDRTAAVAYVINSALEDNSIVSLNEATEIAHSNGIPIIADAASQIYPLDSFRRNAQTPDLACFGAKYFGSPHSTGIVAGKKDLIDAVAAQGFISYHYDGNNAVGRGMKIDRQEIVGVISALDIWFSMNHENRFMEYDRKMTTIEQGLRGLEGVQTKIVNNKRFWAVTLQVILNTNITGQTAQDVADKLDKGNPRIWVMSEGRDTLTINVHTLNQGEESIIADRLREIISAPSSAE